MIAVLLSLPPKQFRDIGSDTAGLDSNPSLRPTKTEAWIRVFPKRQLELRPASAKEGHIVRCRPTRPINRMPNIREYLMITLGDIRRRRICTENSWVNEHPKDLDLGPVYTALLLHRRGMTLPAKVQQRLDQACQREQVSNSELSRKAVKFVS